MSRVWFWLLKEISVVHTQDPCALWFLVRNEGMGVTGTTIRDYHRDPCPRSVSRTRRACGLGGVLELLGPLRV